MTRDELLKDLILEVSKLPQSEKNEILMSNVYQCKHCLESTLSSDRSQAKHAWRNVLKLMPKKVWLKYKDDDALRAELKAWLKSPS